MQVNNNAANIKFMRTNCHPVSVRVRQTCLFSLVLVDQLNLAKKNCWESKTTTYKMQLMQYTTWRYGGSAHN